MIPVIAVNVLQSIEILANGARLFATRCVAGIEANEARCLELVERSLSLGTALLPRLGYDGAAAVVNEAAAHRQDRARDLPGAKPGPARGARSPAGPARHDPKWVTGDRRTTLNREQPSIRGSISGRARRGSGLGCPATPCEFSASTFPPVVGGGVPLSAAVTPSSTTPNPIPLRPFGTPPPVPHHPTASHQLLGFGFHSIKSRARSITLMCGGAAQATPAGRGPGKVHETERTAWNIATTCETSRSALAAARATVGRGPRSAPVRPDDAPARARAGRHRRWCWRWRRWARWGFRRCVGPAPGRCRPRA